MGNGTIKTWKGSYGFVLLDTGETAFVHKSALDPKPKEGDSMEGVELRRVRVTEGPKGLKVQRAVWDPPEGFVSLLIPFRNSRNIAEVEGMGQVVAHKTVSATSTQAGSTYISYEALVWDGVQWWHARIPKFDYASSRNGGGRRPVEWRALDMLSAWNFMRDATESLREDLSVLDDYAHRMNLMARTDPRWVGFEIQVATEWYTGPDWDYDRLSKEYGEVYQK